MNYKIVSTHKVNRFSSSEDFNQFESLNISITSLITQTRECLVWLIDDAYRYSIRKERYPIRKNGKPAELKELPLLANYFQTGSSDIRDKIILQDPINLKGPYILDLSEDRENKLFHKGNLQGFGFAEIIDVHSAGDKIPYYRYYFIGAVPEVFAELEENGYSFSEEALEED